MPIRIVAIDLATTVFELAAADEHWNIVERRRLSRADLERYFENSTPVHVVMEACGTAHHWARVLASRGMTVSLLPALYVRPYVRRNKTDKADATALLEASRASDIAPVPVKSVEQQALQGLHRIRAAWQSTCTARVNALRGLCREFGITAPVGRRRGLAEISRVLRTEPCAIPRLCRDIMITLLEEIHTLEHRLNDLDRQLNRLAQQSTICTRLQTVPGIGLIGSTAIAAAISDIHTFRRSRQLASWLGLTPKEYSSGNSRRLGSISKRGDRYLRSLLVQGGRAVLYSADTARTAGRPLDALRAWALRVRDRVGHNKAAVAVANKLARIIWAIWHRQCDFEFRPQQEIPAV
jgi:transposase